MSEMIERGAKAMYERKFRNQGFKWEDSTAQDEWFDLMCTAIEEMRKPTRDMLLAGHGANLCENAPEVWQAMIDEALK